MVTYTSNLPRATSVNLKSLTADCAELTDFHLTEEATAEAAGVAAEWPTVEDEERSLWAGWAEPSVAAATARAETTGTARL